MKKGIFYLFMLAAVPSFAVWDKTLPLGSEAKSMGDDRIREMKTDIEDALEHQGSFPGPDTSNPRYINTVSSGTTADRPSGSTNTAAGMFYVNTSSGCLEQYNGTTWDCVGLNTSTSTITSTMLDTSVAGAGLGGGGGYPLHVQASTDNFTITNDTVTIKTGGVTSTELADTITIPTLSVTTSTWAGFGVLPILQVVQGTQNTTANYNSATFVDTSVSVTIAPKISTSKVFVMASFTIEQAAGDIGYVSLARDGSNLGGDKGMHQIPASNNDCVTLQFVDAPTTTNSVVYTVAYRNGAAAGSADIPAETDVRAIIMAVEIAQ